MVGPPEFPEHWKKLGPATVRLMMQTARIAPAFYPSAELWLAEEEEQERLRNEASQASQMRIALSAKLAAWIAAVAAIIAAALAAISTAIAIYMLLK